MYTTKTRWGSKWRKWHGLALMGIHLARDSTPVLLKPEHEHQVSDTDSHRRRASGTPAPWNTKYLRLLRRIHQGVRHSKRQRREESISGGAGVSPREEVRVVRIQRGAGGAGRAGGHEEAPPGRDPEASKKTGALWIRGTQTTAPGGQRQG